MRIKTLYQYTRPDGGMTIATAPPEGEYLNLYRLIADEGMVLQKDGGEFYLVIDVEDVTGWVEGIPIEPEEPEAETPRELVYLHPPVDPQSLMVNELDYIEWINYKKRMETVERKIANITTTVGGAALQLQELEDLL